MASFFAAAKGISAVEKSPASTQAPSPNFSWASPQSVWSTWSTGDDLEGSYLALPEPEVAGPELPLSSRTGPAQGKRYLTRALLLVATPAQGKRYLTRALLVVATLASIAALLSPTPPPRLWDPDLRAEFRGEPLAKSVIRKFDGYNMARGGLDDPATFRANVELYMSPDVLYESVGFGNWRTPPGWARGEEHNYGMTFPETIFTQMLFFGDRAVSTTTTYGRALWSGDFLGVPASHTWVNLRITDFYLIREESPGWGRITYNFMMIDWADLMRQVGRPLLAPAALPEGLVLPPAANDGVPAPLSAVVQAEGRDEALANRTAEAALREWVGQGGAPRAGSWHEDMTFYGPGGVGLAEGAAAYEEHVLKPFHAAFANRTAHTRLSACEGNYCSAFGELRARGVGSWLGMPTQGRDVAIRFAMHWRVVGSKAKEGWAIFDIPGLFSQLDLDFWKMAARGGSPYKA